MKKLNTSDKAFVKMADFNIVNYEYGTEECNDYIDSLDLFPGGEEEVSVPEDGKVSREFLITSVADSQDDGDYIIKAFGIFPNGKQKILHITGIKPYVDIHYLDPSIQKEVEAFARNRCCVSWGKAKGVAPVVTTVEGKYLIGLNEVTKWHRFEFTSLFSRTTFLRGIQNFYADGKLYKSNDKKTDYCIIAARHNGFSISSWNNLNGKPKRVVGDSMWYPATAIQRAENPSVQALQNNTTSISWDIETYYYDWHNRKDGVPLPEDPNSAMSCVSMVVKSGKTFKSFTTISTYGAINFTPRVEPSAQTNKKEIRSTITTHNHIHCKDERELLEAFFMVIISVKPDIMIAFNDFDYDWKWIIGRTITHKLNSEAFIALSGLVYHNPSSGNLTFKAQDANRFWAHHLDGNSGGNTTGSSPEETADELDSDNEDVDEVVDLPEEAEDADEIDDGADYVLREKVKNVTVSATGDSKKDGPLTTPTKMMIKLEAGESMMCVFPNSFCRMVFLDTRVILRKANPKIDTSSLNYYLEHNGLGKKNDMDHNVAQELTAALRWKSLRKKIPNVPYGEDQGEIQAVSTGVSTVIKKHYGDLVAIGIEDPNNVNEVLAIMLNYCLIDSVKTAILLDVTDEVLSKRMLADLSSVSLIHAFYRGVSVQITNILSQYCDKPEFSLKYSTDTPLDKDESGQKYAGALVLNPKIMGSFTPLNFREKYEQQKFYQYGYGNIEDTQLKLSFKEATPEGTAPKSTLVTYNVDSVNFTDFERNPRNLQTLLGNLENYEDFFVSTKAVGDMLVNTEYKEKVLRFFRNEASKTLNSPEFEGTVDDHDWLPEEEVRGEYKFLETIVNGIFPLDNENSTLKNTKVVTALKNFYRYFVYVNTTLNDFYILDTKDIPVGQLCWFPRFLSKKLDYITLIENLDDILHEYTVAVKMLTKEIYRVYKQQGLSGIQVEFLMEPAGLATTALDFSSLYPSIIEEFNLSIDKMIISTGKPELYKEYVDNKDFKTIYCYYGNSEPNVAHCKNHNNDLKDYGVYSYILRELKVVRTDIRKELKGVDKKTKVLQFGLGRKAPEKPEEFALVLDKSAFSEEEWFDKNRQCDELENQCAALDSKQNAVKVVMNSFYGSTGNKNSQARCIEMSAGITAEGVKHLKLARDVIEEQGVTIRYGDTDSLYFSRNVIHNRENLLAFYKEEIDSTEYNKRDVKAAMSYADLVQGDINSTIKRKNNNAGVMKMAYEEALKPFFNLNKKRYLGFQHHDPDNVSFNITDKEYFYKKQMFTRGMDFKKRSSTAIGIEVINRMLLFMLDPSNTRIANELGAASPAPWCPEEITLQGDAAEERFYARNAPPAPFGNIVSFVKNEIRSIIAMEGLDRTNLLLKFAKKYCIKKKPNLVVASLRERLPSWELPIGSSVKAVVTRDKEPPVSAKGKKEGVSKTHRTYPVDYVIEHPELDLDLSGYLEGQFTAQLSDLVSFLYQPYVPVYIKEYNVLTPRTKLVGNDLDISTKVLKNLAAGSIKSFIKSVTNENNIYSVEELKLYDKFSKDYFKLLQADPRFQRVEVYQGFPLLTLQQGLAPTSPKWRFADQGEYTLPEETNIGELPKQRQRQVPTTFVNAGKKNKIFHPNFKTRGNKKAEKGINEVNESNIYWLVDLFINLWIQRGNDPDLLNINKLRDNMNLYEIPFLEDLDALKAIDKFVDKLILQNRVSIQEFFANPRADHKSISVERTINALYNTKLGNEVTKNIIGFFKRLERLSLW